MKLLKCCVYGMYHMYSSGNEIKLLLLPLLLLSQCVKLHDTNLKPLFAHFDVVKAAKFKSGPSAHVNYNWACHKFR